MIAPFGDKVPTLNASVHLAPSAIVIGDDVTVGHAVVLHGCTVGNHALIGMGAIVLDGAEIGEECLVGAGAVVTPGTHVAPRGLVLGSPGRRVRDLNGDEIARLHQSAANYVEHAQRYRVLGLV